MGLFDNSEPDWRSVADVMDYLDKRRETAAYFLKDRPSMCRFRLRQEALALEKIDYFGGDFIAEEYKPRDLRNLPLLELNLLKRAMERNVKVRVLSKWDTKSTRLTYWVGEYVKAGVDIKKWNGEIRGGIYDGDIMYVVQTSPKVPLSELSLQYLETVPSKEVGEPQDDKIFPLRAIVTRSPSLIKKYKNRFDKEYKSAVDMKIEIDRTEKSNTEKISENKDILML